MFRTILFTAVASLLIAMPAWAADDVDEVTSVVGGTIPELCQIILSGTGNAALMTVTQDGTGEPAYDAGYIESAADAVILTLDANMAWQLGCNYQAAWTDPAGYDKAEADLEVKITAKDTGTYANSFDSYQAVPAAKTAMLTHTAGVSNNVVNIQTRVLLDWTKDIPGVYSITVVYTMETTT